MKKVMLFLIVVMFLLVPILIVAETDYGAIIQEAATKGDVKLCDKIDIPTGKDACILGVAVAIGDIKLCDTMSEISKMAYQDKICKATVTFDIKYCDEIGVSALKTNCYSIVEENKKRGNIPPAQNPPVQQPVKTKSKCTTDKECGNKVCSSGKCVEPKITFVFVPVNWKGTMDDFDKKVDERVNLLLNAIPLKDCKSSVKIIKSHENCEITLSPHLYVVPWTYKDLLAVRDCVRRITTYYDYGVGLTDAQQSLYPKVGGVQSRLTMTALVTTNRTFATIHELGHLFGLKDEYCNDVSITSPLSVIYRKCGFDISPNPLKTEYGCREKDSSYDNDEFPDCCWSDKYEPGCKGNVGLSESEFAKKIYDSGAYEAIDGIFENNNILYDGIMKCKTDNDIKEKLKKSLALLEKNTSKFYDIQTKIGFKTLFSFQEDLKNLNEITKCLKETEFCDCLTGGRTTNTMAIMSSIKTMSLKPYEILVFDRYSIMADTEGRLGQPTEFSKPAYDYLSTLPKMQCPADTSTASSTPETTSPSSVSETDKNSFYWNIDWFHPTTTEERTISFKASSGKKISGRLAYTLWNAPTCGPKRNICDCIDHIVLGTDSEPLYCFKAGIPGCYPGKSGEITFSFNAPTTSGTYILYSLLTTTYNCNDAFEAYKTAINKKAAGKMVVSK